jgi:enoyl-CoA hydratase/carnithine racemase
MSKLSDYADKYKCARLERRDGILQITLHTEGRELRWGLLPHEELPELFHDIAQDRENKVVILTGTGSEFSGPRPDMNTKPFPVRPDGPTWDKIYHEGKKLLLNMLNIEVPMIGAVNGPAYRHSELPLLCDIVVASETAEFQDSAHFTGGLVPGDGVHIVYPLLLGLNRARYFLLTGQTLNAQEARDYGLVNEVLPPDQILGRAWELAERIASYPELHRRYARVLLTEDLRRRMNDLLGYGLALEGLALMERPLPKT